MHPLFPKGSRSWRTFGPSCRWIVPPPPPPAKQAGYGPVGILAHTHLHTLEILKKKKKVKN